MRWLLPTLVLLSGCARGRAPSLDTVEGVQALWVRQRANLSVALVSPGDEVHGRFWNADTPRPLASTVKILVLVAYAAAVSRGELSEDARVPLAEWDALYVRYDGGAHRQVLADLEKRGAVENGTVALREVAHAMIRFSDNAATDLLLLRLGRPAMDAAVAQLKLPGLQTPHPLGGELLAMTAKVPTAQLADDAWTRSGRLATDPEFRRSENARINGGLGLSEEENRAAMLSGNNQGTARAYAALMSRIFSGALPGDDILRRELEWPMAFASNQKTFERFGTKGGSLPGILTSATWVKPKDGAAKVLAIFVHGLPDDAYRTLGESYRHQDFERRLLTDEAFAKAFFEALTAGESDRAPPAR